MEPESGAERARVGEDRLGWERLLAGARVRARSLCRNSQVDPDDLVQEAFARLLLDLEKVRDRASWLARVLTNLYLSELRRLRVRSAGRPGPWLGEEGAEDSERVDARVDLRRHLRQLSDPDRSCLTLYATGHTHREIGERLGQPVHRVGPRISRAVARLRRLLARRV